MNISSNTLRIGLASIVIVGTVAYLAISGASASKSYFVTIPELVSMGDGAYTKSLRVSGFVEPGSIEHAGPHVQFRMVQYESHSQQAKGGQNTRILTVNYNGQEPPPDTFKDDANAVAFGSYGRDGVFHATQLQAKCASKYAAAPNQSQASNAQPAERP